MRIPHAVAGDEVETDIGARPKDLLEWRVIVLVRRESFNNKVRSGTGRIVDNNLISRCEPLEILKHGRETKPVVEMPSDDCITLLSWCCAQPIPPNVGVISRHCHVA